MKADKLFVMSNIIIAEFAVFLNLFFFTALLLFYYGGFNTFFLLFSSLTN